MSNVSRRAVLRGAAALGAVPLMQWSSAEAAGAVRAETAVQPPRRTRAKAIRPTWLADEASLPVRAINVELSQSKGSIKWASSPSPLGEIIEIPPGDYRNVQIVHNVTATSSYQPGSRIIFRCSRGRAKLMSATCANFFGTPRIGIEFDGIDFDRNDGPADCVRCEAFTFVGLYNFSLFNSKRNGLFIPPNANATLHVKDGVIHHVAGDGLYHGAYVNKINKALFENVHVHSIRANGPNNAGHCLKLYADDVQVFGCSFEPTLDEPSSYPNFCATFAPLDIGGYGQSTVVWNRFLRASPDARNEIVSWRNRVWPLRYGEDILPDLKGRPWRHLFAFNDIANTSSNHSNFALWNDGVWPGMTQNAPDDWITRYADWSRQDSIVYHYGNTGLETFGAVGREQPFGDGNPFHAAPILPLTDPLPQWVSDRLEV